MLYREATLNLFVVNTKKPIYILQNCLDAGDDGDLSLGREVLYYSRPFKSVPQGS